MKFILLISNAFINTMGITQPSPQAANRAAWFIVVMLTAVLAAIATIAIIAIHGLPVTDSTSCYNLHSPTKKAVLPLLEWRMIAADVPITN